MASQLTNNAKSVRVVKRKNTSEQKNLTDAKLNLKRTKRFTAEIEQIAIELHSSQCDILTLSRTLSEKLKNIQISDISDKFGIFANNMGLAISSNHMEEMQEMHLMNLEDDFIKPLNQFNKVSVAKSQKLKNKLNKITNSQKLKNRTSFKKKTNITRKNSTKITNKNVKKKSKKITNKNKTSVKKVTNKNKNNKKSFKKITNKNNKKSFKKSTNKNKKTINKSNENIININSEQLLAVQNEFIKSVADMETDKIDLVSSFKSYFQSYSIFTNLNSQNIKLYGNTMHNMPSRTSKFSVHSTDFDIDDDKQKGTIEKEGWMKKKGGINSNKPFKKRWFKLFRNKKLKYFDKPNGVSKGHADFTNIIKMEIDNTHNNDGKFAFCVVTQSRIWIFELETEKNRNDWYETIERVCYKNNDENALEIELDGPQITMMSVDDSNNYLSHAQRNYIRSKPGYQAKNMLNTPINEGQFGMISMNEINTCNLVVVSDGDDNNVYSPVFSPLPAYYISNN